MYGDASAKSGVMALAAAFASHECCRRHHVGRDVKVFDFAL
jgi:hypothetical protein